MNENYSYGAGPEGGTGELETQDSIESLEYSNLYTSKQLDEILEQDILE